MKRLFGLALLPVVLSACQMSAPIESDPFPQKEWRHEDGADAFYLLAPGDQLEVIVHTAPELSRTVTVGPDGRFRMPYSGPILAAARTVDQVREGVQYAMATELNNPDIDVLLAGTASQRIFVGGDVTSPGLFEMPGLIDPLQAIIMAGGVTDTGNARTVVLMRRMPGGEVKSAVFDLKAGVYDPSLADWAPLRRFDVVYVTRKPIADQNLFVRQYIRDALPIDFSLFYDIAGNNR
ncbi:MAG: polysaccharide biosynthesis/export family protein [Pseudomonadota bacterium]